MNAGPFDAVPRIESTPLIPEGFSWTESPRWHDGSLFFSDMYNRRVIRAESDGTWSVYLDASGRETLEGVDLVTVGSGFLPDGRLLLNSMYERVTLVWDGSSLEVYADLREVAESPINDMVIDAQGRVYISQLGYDLLAGEEKRTSKLLVIDPDRSVRVLESAGDVAAANGLAITADGTTLIAAEVDGPRLTAWDIQADGEVGNRRVFADVPWLPDGIALDVDGGVWAAMPGSGYVVRVLEGGALDTAVAIPMDKGMGIACVLGGPDRSTLFITAGLEVFDREASRKGALGSIWSAETTTNGMGVRP